MLRISKLTDYATVILAQMMVPPERLHTAAGVSEATGIAQPTVTKLLKQLQKSHLVTSVRGTHGGYQLARPPASISAAEILDALEGPIAITECAGNDSHCGIEHACRVGHSWQRINNAIRRALQDINLHELADATASRTPDIAAEIRAATQRAHGRGQSSQ
jgi:FeS assembly SUF system regulator